MKPLAYGYMRVFCDAADEQVRSLEQRIRQRAEGHGYEFATTFQETTDGSHEAFDELIEEIKRSGAEHVVLPSFNHLSRNSVLQSLLLARLEEAAEVEVHTLRAETEEAGYSPATRRGGP